MKYRILGALAIVIILIVVALFGKSLVFPNSNNDQTEPTKTQPANDSGFKF